MTDVVVLQWPAQADEAAALSEARKPHLLLVAEHADPPDAVEWWQEWVRLPADERDVAARVLSLTRRTGPVKPRVDDNGRLFYGTQWVALSPTEARLARRLADRFDELVPEADLVDAGWPERSSRWPANTLRVYLTRLRHRLEPLGLEIKTIRSQGFVLHSA